MGKFAPADRHSHSHHFNSPHHRNGAFTSCLQRKIGWLRWTCIIFGFAGALIITQPGTENFNASYGIALLAVLASATVMLCLRSLGKSEDTLTTMFYFFGFGTIVTSLILPSSGQASPHPAYLSSASSSAALSIKPSKPKPLNMPISHFSARLDTPISSGQPSSAGQFGKKSLQSTSISAAL